MNSRTTNLRLSLPKGISSIDTALLEQLFDQVAEIAFFVKDANGCYVTVNQSLVVRHGLKSKTQVIGKRPSEICEGEFGRIPTEQDEMVLKKGKPMINHLEMQWHLPNDAVWCLTTKLPIHDVSGAIIGIIGFSRDIRAQVDPKDLPEAFVSALAEFEQNLAPDVTPAWFAQRSQMSLARLGRLTKRLFDLTPSQFIAKTRIASASQMLLETEQSVAEIAHACGFYDQSAFARSFRLAIGIPPTEFRSKGRLALNARPSS